MSSLQAIPAADLELLRRFDTPTICNVIELFNIRPRTAGYMDAHIRCCFPHMPPMVGYASTATFRSSSPPRASNVYAGLHEQVSRFGELPGPAVVVFQDLDDPVASATFGEVMCTTYKAFGAAGIITSGAGRDLDQVEALGFTCFSDGTVCAHGYCHIVQLHVPVSVGGITVHPGDIIHGDRNSVTTGASTRLPPPWPTPARTTWKQRSIVLSYLKSVVARFQGLRRRAATVPGADRGHRTPLPGLMVVGQECDKKHALTRLGLTVTFQPPCPGRPLSQAVRQRIANPPSPVRIREGPLHSQA